MTDTKSTPGIANSAFFEGLDRDMLDFLEANAQLRRLAADEVLFPYGAPADAFYLVRSGRIKVEVAAITGLPLGLQELEPGAVLGWSWLIPPYRWHFQARAMTDSEVLVFDGPAVRARCEQDPAFGFALLKRFSQLMSERMEQARRTMMEAWTPPGFA
ncbi:Crp/Fnr family transcriptional regulator [Algiphilus sp.]|uniref:Crp/Fnr family transcriptional regulator n=1 Tax=Algiphilus sp. TaxID=1872431 RepID=UPI002A618FFE|nr:Crp/Fnr family transcriptional regulator [Pseudomonadota bacterium]